MAFDIDDRETEELVHELARRAGLPVEEAIKRAAPKALQEIEASPAALEAYIAHAHKARPDD
ncbi:type II toxin-antitoxin system VapB family antitoxin [Reyranella sp.]|uniref:type II toxin-antitoxin system VapB family antitoxin n=1 Tax=Reyranella sp. TaxID=1929291 RepID=UPI003D141560